MAITAEVIDLDGPIFVDFRPGESSVERVARDPSDLEWPFYFYWSPTAEFVALEILDTADISNSWVEEIEKLDLPRVDAPVADMNNVSIAELLRWIRQAYPSHHPNRKARVSA